MSHEIERQCGMLTHSQAHALGYSSAQIRSWVSRGIWQRPHRGTYATFSGPMPRSSVIWGVVLAAGDGATLSHYSAAEVAGFNEEPKRPVYVTVPWPRTAPRITGGVVRVSRRLDLARHPIRLPPQTRVEETVLDLADVAETADEAIRWLIAACAQRLTTSKRVGEAMEHRKRLRWRREMAASIEDTGAGAWSVLERRYLRDVERAHGLPRGERQAQHERLGGNIYDDVLYREYGLVVELDGRANHRHDRQFRDLDRDNVAGARGDSVLHYGWTDVTTRPCAVAAQVAEVLDIRGWSGRPHRCRRQKCMIVRS